MGFLFNEKGQMIRKDGSVVENTQKGRKAGPRKTAANKSGRISHLKVDAILGGEGPLRDEYERLVGNPNTYLKHLVAWFSERGHHVNIHAIRRHRERFNAEYRSVRETTRMAEAYCKITGDHGTGAIMGAAQGRAEMLMMQDLFEIKEKGGLPPEHWQAWARALRDTASARKGVEALRVEFERRTAERAQETLDPQEANRRVVERVNEILGLGPLPKGM